MRHISSKSGRRLATGALVMVAGPLTVGSVAYACGGLATARITSSASVQAGQTITVFGKGYGTPAEGLTDIQFRLNTRDGAIIATAPPLAREFTTTVTIPQGTAVGTHTLVITQFQGNGTMVSGAPGRVSFDVVGAASRTSSAAGPVEAASAPVAATPAAAAPATASAAPATANAAPAAVTPAAGAASASTATAPAAATTGAAPAAVTAPAAAASTDTAVAAPSAPAAAAEAVSPVPAAGSAVASAGFLPASSSSSSTLPGLSLAAALAMVLLALGAFVKTGRSMVGRSGSLAG